MISPTLYQGLGPIDGAAIVVSNVIGSGIFIVPAIVAASVPNAWAMLGVWLAGGLLAFAGAMAYAELAALRPRAGGEYVYLREAFGPAAGFLTGWTSFVAGFSGAIAASAVGLAGYLARFFPAAGDTTPIFEVPLGLMTLTVSSQTIVALSAIAVLSAVHILGLGPGRVVQNLLAGSKIALLVGFIVLGFGFGQGATTNFSVSGTTIMPSSWVLALIPVMFAYSGWNAATYLAEEMRAPGRNVPLALGIGTVVVVVIYLLLNMLYVYAMPVTAFVNVRRKRSRCHRRAFVWRRSGGADRGSVSRHDRGQHQRDGSGWSPRVLRHGAGWAILCGRGQSPPEVSNTHHRHRGAECMGRCACAVRHLSAARRLYRFCCGALFRCRGSGTIRPAFPAADGTSPV